MLKEKSDEELMLAYQLGDENAFRELYTRHSSRVFGFVRAKVREEAKARDIFQATFLKLHKSRNLYNSSLPFVPWLFTICRSELLDAFKKESRLKEDIVSETPEIIPTRSLAQDIDLSTLNESQKQALEMRYGLEATFTEIAKALETSPANARQIVSRALRAMRSLYGKK